MRPSLILHLSGYDLKGRFAGSRLGIFWAFVSPVVTVLLYWFVFQSASGKGTEDGIPYVIWLICGIVPWFFFSEAVTGSANALTDYSYLVKKMKFEFSSLPLIRTLSALWIHLFFVGIAFGILLLSGFAPRLTWIQIPYEILASFSLSLSLGKVLSAICGMAKDISHGVGILIQIGFWLTPIFWNSGDLPPVLESLLRLNPAAYLVQGYRDSLLHGTWFWERPIWSLYFWLVVTVLYFLGRWLYQKWRPLIVDRI